MASTIADDEEGVKYRHSSRRHSRPSQQSKKSKLNKKALETFSESQKNSNEGKNEEDLTS